MKKINAHTKENVHAYVPRITTNQDKFVQMGDFVATFMMK
jgi:hypothetical protein